MTLSTFSDYFWLFQTMSDFFRLFQTTSDYFRLFQTISYYLGIFLFRTTLDYFQLFLINSDYFRLFWKVLWLCYEIFWDFSFEKKKFTLEAEVLSTFCSCFKHWRLVNWRSTSALQIPATPPTPTPIIPKKITKPQQSVRYESPCFTQ